MRCVPIEGIEFNSLEELSRYFQTNAINRTGGKDLYWYYDILRKYCNKPEVTVAAEFGTYQGASAATMLSCDVEKVLSYDIVTRAECAYTNDIIKSLKGDKEYTYEERSTFDGLPEEVDLLFLDNAHNKDHVRRELDTHASKVKHYIIIHDTLLCDESEPLSIDTKMPIVRHAVTDFIADNTEWELVEEVMEYAGVGVIRKIHETV